MRTTLAIDDDVLATAKGIAKRQHKSVGEVISELARQALRPTSDIGSQRNGVPLLPTKPGTMPVTPELVNQLRDELS
ncbi:MAG: CopG family transcriptional regulator [Rhizomicrobium sp.]